MTALLLAASKGHSGVVKVLLEAGASTEAKNITHTHTHTHVHMDILILTLFFASIEAPATRSTLIISV